MIYGVIISNHTCRVKRIRPCPWFHEGGTAVVITASRLSGGCCSSEWQCNMFVSDRGRSLQIDVIKITFDKTFLNTGSEGITPTSS